MPRPSDPLFRTFHALRIKGFARAEMVADVAALPLDHVQVHLADLQAREWTQYRESRELWQLTHTGREQHRFALSADVGDPAAVDELRDSYVPFLGINERFKLLCGEWQLRNGAANDHTDAAYDRAVIARLLALNEEAQPVVQAMGEVFERMQPYAPRLVTSCQRLLSGETNMFTGVMCGSYHDVWMELHEDLILTQAIDRSAEGSF